MLVKLVVWEEGQCEEAKLRHMLDVWVRQSKCVYVWYIFDSGSHNSYRLWLHCEEDVPFISFSFRLSVDGFLLTDFEKLSDWVQDTWPFGCFMNTHGQQLLRSLWLNSICRTITSLQFKITGQALFFLSPFANSIWSTCLFSHFNLSRCLNYNKANYVQKCVLDKVWVLRNKSQKFEETILPGLYL